MPIVTIIDIAESKRIEPENKKALMDDIHRELVDIGKSYKDIIGPQIVLGDSIQLVSSDWVPPARTIHYMLTRNLRLYVGIGTSRIMIYHKDINRCDGPAFWNAREAIDILKKTRRHTKYTPPALLNIKLEQNTPTTETNNVKLIVLYSLWINNLRKETRRYAYEYIWRGKREIDIAKKEKKERANISIILRRHQFDIVSLIKNLTL